MNYAPTLGKLFPPRLWALALIAVVAFAATDTIVHLRTTWNLVGRHPSGPPITDASSPSGYVDNQHELILPYPGIDTYHWIMQTQAMFDGAGLRIREVDYDNAPDGREVHWSSLIRWWLGALAFADHATTLTPLPQSVEEVAPMGSVLLIVSLIVAVTPLVARRFGSVIAALFAFGAIGVGPFYESFTVGRTDHHGLTALADLLSMLILVAGGAGWVRTNDIAPDENDVLMQWLPKRAQARQWFIASAIVGGVGLWVSAAAVAFVLVFLGMGGLLASGLLGRHLPANSEAIPDPSLWRVWGWTGAATSLFFYLLEYFPSHMGMRLEVNHPLYALAWAGGGELTFRLSRWWADGKLAHNFNDVAWLVGGTVAVVTLPAVVLLFKGAVFTPSDPFLWKMHNDYIEEFFPLWQFLKSQPFFLFVIMVNPLVLLVAPIVAWTWPGLRIPLRWMLVVGAPILSVIFAVIPESTLTHHFWLAGLNLCAALIGSALFWEKWGDFPRPAKALLLLVMPPSVIMFAWAVKEVRWIEMSYALWLGALVAVAAATRLNRGFRWSPIRIVAVVLFLCWTMLPNPAFTAFYWLLDNWKGEVSQVEALELIMRDVSQTLRAREGDNPVVVVSGPTSSTWLLYWGGFKSLGTYYWENLAGMKANADIYAAKTDDEALRLLQAHHATHLVIFTWVDNPAEYTRIVRGMSKDDPAPKDAFAWNLIHGGNFPSWLSPVYYAMPPGDVYKNMVAFVFEIAPNQSKAESLVRLAQFEMQSGHDEDAIHELDEALRDEPDNIAAIATAARIDTEAGKADLFTACLHRLQSLLPKADKLAFDDRADACTVFGLANDDRDLRTQLDICLASATVDKLRKLRPDALYNLIALANNTGQLAQRPGMFDEAMVLLPLDLRVKLLMSFADKDNAAGKSAECLRLLRRAAAFAPDAVPLLNRLAAILLTVKEDNLRNGKDALAFATHAYELDRGQHVNITDALACACAETGDFAAAEEKEKEAIALAENANAPDIVKALQGHLALFEHGKTIRQ